MKTRILFSIIVIFLILISVIALHHHSNKKQHQLSHLQAVPVEVSKIQTKKIPNIAFANGILQAVQSTTISPKESGYVTQINYHEGEAVKAGQILVQLDNHAEQAALKSAEIAEKISSKEYARTIPLYKKHLITQPVYYQSKVTNLKNIAILNADKIKLANKTIIAPFTGIVGSKNVSIGDFVNAGSKITTLVDIQHLRVQYALPTKYQALIQLGQPVILTSSAFPGKQFYGKVTYISADIDPTTQTIELHANVDNPKKLLKPGEFVSIRQQLGPAKSAILVPTQSVVPALTGYYVYGVKNDKAIKIPVTIGKKFSQGIEISKGLSVGEKIIVAGAQHISAGSRVKIIKANQKS